MHVTTHVHLRTHTRKSYKTYLRIILYVKELNEQNKKKKRKKQNVEILSLCPKQNHETKAFESLNLR